MYALTQLHATLFSYASSIVSDKRSLELASLFILRSVPLFPDVRVLIEVEPCVLVDDCTYLAHREGGILLKRVLTSVFVYVFLSVFVSVFLFVFCGGCT